MSFFDTSEQAQAAALANLVRVNPFLPERLTAERDALGGAFVPGRSVWSSGEDLDNPNVGHLAMMAAELSDRWRRRLRNRTPDPHERQLLLEVSSLALYERTEAALYEEVIAGDPVGRVPYWPAFLKDHERTLGEPGLADSDPAHLFACFYQIRRAFQSIFHTLSGSSSAAATLRAAAWRAVFGADPSRYRRFLYRTLPDVPTLITGPTGTGKELVASAIGHSGYIPFDPDRQRFVAPPTFRALHLAAVPAGLLESELFGHRKGAFTGAIHDHVGWLGELPPGATVFLDEIGELDPVVQVKLLRVLEDRTFLPVGSRDPMRFIGKVVAATHVDLEAAIADGGFRQDLFYRLCGDRIRTPTLRRRLDDEPDELRQIVRALLGRTVPPEAVTELLDDVCGIITRDRGAHWPWPGNVRELAQCVRQALVHGACTDVSPRSNEGLEGLAGLDATMADVQRRYASAVYRKAGSYRAAASVLGIDWRTVRSLVEAESA